MRTQSVTLPHKSKFTKKNQKIIKILDLQGFNYVTVWVNSLWKRSQILCERVTDSLYFCFAQEESQTAVLEHFEDDEYYYLYILYFERFGFCALSVWAMLDFRIQFNELLNSVADKNENKNPYTEVNTCTTNDFLFTVLKWILNTMKPHVFKICGPGQKKKKKKKQFCIPLLHRPIENDFDPKYFFIETNRFFLLPKFIFCS